MGVHSGSLCPSGAPRGPQLAAGRAWRVRDGEAGGRGGVRGRPWAATVCPEQL